MNNTRATAQKHDAVMTFVFAVMFVVSAVAFSTYIAVHELVPAIQHFLATIAQPRSN